MTDDAIRVAIVGGGTMGTLIGLRCAFRGKDVRIYDASPEVRERIPARLQDWAGKVAQQSDVGQALLDTARTRIRVAGSLADGLTAADVVIEAVTERPDVKRAVWADIARSGPADALLGTTSSSLPCSRLADVTGRPERMVNMHFPQAWEGVPVEVMGNPETTPETLAEAVEFVGSLGLLHVLVKKEIMGFGLNTIWHEVKRIALHVADGYLDFEEIDRYWLLGGNRIPIFGHMDMIGLDVVRDIEMQYFAASGDERDRPPAFLDRMVEQGRLGVKTGQGFYTYPHPEFEHPGWLRKEPPWTNDRTIRIE
jgi:3-hydroxybutyryl-CoA dehydrogenase